jgi:hypothetical protein
LLNVVRNILTDTEFTHAGKPEQSETVHQQIRGRLERASQFAASRGERDWPPRCPLPRGMQRAGLRRQPAASSEDTAATNQSRTCVRRSPMSRALPCRAQNTGSAHENVSPSALRDGLRRPIMQVDEIRMRGRQG